jgi:hypothetical protein
VRSSPQVIDSGPSGLIIRRSVVRVHPAPPRLTCGDVPGPLPETGWAGGGC